MAVSAPSVFIISDVRLTKYVINFFYSMQLDISPGILPLSPLTSKRLIACGSAFQEGTFTCLFGILTTFFIPASVNKAKFLAEEKRSASLTVLQADLTADEEHEPFSWSVVLSAFKAPHLVIMSVDYFSNGDIFAIIVGVC